MDALYDARSRWIQDWIKASLAVGTLPITRIHRWRVVDAGEGVMVYVDPEKETLVILPTPDVFAVDPGAERSQLEQEVNDHLQRTLFGEGDDED